MRTPEWKYVEYLADDTAELYHLEPDPHEMSNLYPSSEHEEILAELQADLREWWAETDGDTDAWTNEPELDFKMPDPESLVEE